jgi:predicted GNAT superfamily acetyltransferase
VNSTHLNAQGFLNNRSIQLDLADRHLLVEIPNNTDAMRSQAMPLARRWRLDARRIFRCYLAKGYYVEDFFPSQPATAGRCFYLLRRVA